MKIKPTLNILKKESSNKLRPLYWISQLQFEKRLVKTRKLIKIWFFHSTRYQKIKTKLKKFPDPRYYYKKYRPAHRLYKHIKFKYKVFNIFNIRLFKNYFTFKKEAQSKIHFLNFKSKNKKFKKLLFRNFFRLKGLVKFIKKKYLGRKRRLKRFLKKNSKNNIIFNRIQARNKRKMKVRLRKRYLRKKFNKKFKMKVNYKPVIYFIKKIIVKKLQYFEFKKKSVDLRAKAKIIRKMKNLFEIEDNKNSKSIIDERRFLGNIAFHNIWITFFHRYNLKKLKKTLSEKMFKNLNQFLNHYKNNILGNTFIIYYFYNFFNFKSIYLKKKTNKFRKLGPKKYSTLITISYNHIASFINIIKNHSLFLKKTFYNNYLKQIILKKKIKQNINNSKNLVKILSKEKCGSEKILISFKEKVFFLRKEELLVQLKKKKFFFFLNKAFREYTRKKNKTKMTDEIALEELEKEKEYMNQNKEIINKELQFLKLKETVYSNLRKKHSFLKTKLLTNKFMKKHSIFKSFNIKIFKGEEFIYYKSFYTWIFVKNLFNKTIYKKLFNPYNVWIFFLIML